MSLWSELQRRKVVRVGVAYMIAALGVAEGADIFLPQLGAPSWVVPVVLVLIVLGLPLAIALAWAYQVTPAGLVREAGVVATTAPALGIVQPPAPAPPHRTDGRPSVAVLPLTNMSGDPGLGHPEDVRQAIDRLSDPDGPGGGPFLLAYLHLAAQDVEKAMDFFEQAVSEGDFLAPFMRCTPRLYPLRAHPRFQALLQRMWPGHGPFEVKEAS